MICCLTVPKPWTYHVMSGLLPCRFLYIYYQKSTSSTIALGYPQCEVFSKDSIVIMSMHSTHTWVKTSLTKMSVGQNVRTAGSNRPSDKTSQGTVPGSKCLPEWSAHATWLSWFWSSDSIRDLLSLFAGTARCCLYFGQSNIYYKLIFHIRPTSNLLSNPRLVFCEIYNL